MLCVAGHSFLQADIGVFRQNIQALEQLNTRWKLYSRPVFAESLLAEFLTVFLQVTASERIMSYWRQCACGLDGPSSSCRFISFLYLFVPFLQCCGSGMINSGSGSSSEFSEFRFRNQIHNTAKIIKYRTFNLGLDLFCLFNFNFKNTTIEDFF